MEKKEAIKFLRKCGWNKDGAEVIVDAIIEEEALQTMTETELKRISDDYADR